MGKKNKGKSDSTRNSNNNGKKEMKNNVDAAKDTKAIISTTKIVVSDVDTNNNDDTNNNNNNQPTEKVARIDGSNKNGNNGGDDDDSSRDDNDSDSESDDELALDGVLVRNPDVSSSSDDDDDEEEDDNDNDDDDEKKPAATSTPTNKKRVNNESTSTNNETVSKRRKKKKSKKSSSKDDYDSNNDDLQVEFTFCDMDEKYFHGIKSLLNNSSTVYCKYSSELSDTMIDNISVGTIISTTSDYSNEDDTVFAFASVINVTTYQKLTSIQYIITNFIVKYCPNDRQQEISSILQGTTKRPVGILLHARMVNMPMEIVYTLHQQLIKDIDWAITNAGNYDDPESVSNVKINIIDLQKSYDFGIIIRLAPCTKDKKTNELYYKYFDDEILFSHAELSYTCPAPISENNSSASTADTHGGGSGKELLCIIILTKLGHRNAIEELRQMVGGEK